MRRALSICCLFGNMAMCVLAAGSEATIKKSSRKQQARNEQATHHEPEERVCEFYTAAVEAVACGARVLLGDRDFEVCVCVCGRAGRAFFNVYRASRDPNRTRLAPWKIGLAAIV